MGQKSKIEWTDASWNPISGCSKVSTGCQKCYAERLFPRVYGRNRVAIKADGQPEESRPRKFTDVWLHPDRLEQPLHWKKPRMIFVNSMSDLFHEDIEFSFIDHVFQVMFLAGQHTFQILTKRPARMLEYCNRYGGTKKLWPLPNVWLGISCENQETADERIPILLQVPAAVRFLSCEPLLDEIDFQYPKTIWPDGPQMCCSGQECGCMGMPVDPPIMYSMKDKIHWIICGGESGPGYRPMNLEWARSIRDQCKATGVPFFFKQTAGKKEIPEDLEVREFPDQEVLDLDSSTT